MSSTNNPEIRINRKAINKLNFLKRGGLTHDTATILVLKEFPETRMLFGNNTELFDMEKLQSSTKLFS